MHILSILEPTQRVLSSTSGSWKEDKLVQREKLQRSFAFTTNDVKIGRAGQPTLWLFDMLYIKNLNFFNVCLETCVWFKKWYFLTSLNLSLDSSTEYHLKLSRKKTKKTCLKTFCQRKMEKWKTSKKYNGSQV